MKVYVHYESPLYSSRYYIIEKGEVWEAVLADLYKYPPSNDPTYFRKKRKLTEEEAVKLLSTDRHFYPLV